MVHVALVRATWTTALLAILVARCFKIEVSDECMRQALHQTLWRLAEQCLARSACRKRRVMLAVDHFRIHTPAGSKRVAALLQRYGRRLTVRYVPKYPPDCMTLEFFWNDWRDHVTHNHDRQHIVELEADSDAYFADCACHPE